MKLHVSILAFASTLAACTPPKLDIEKQWTEAMQRQSLYAIFPVSEDIMVGDVLLDTRSAKSSADDEFQAIRIARSDPDAVINALCRDRKRRIEILPSELGPAGTVSGADGEAVRNETKDTTGAEKFVQCADDPEQTVIGEGNAGAFIGEANAANASIRLSRSAIPEAQVARITEAQLGAAGIFGNFGANIGLGSSNRTALTIKLNNLQFLELPPRYSIELFKELLERPTAIDPDVVLLTLEQRSLDDAKHVCA